MEEVQSIVNTFLAIIGKGIALIILLGSLLTGATTLPTQPVATGSTSSPQATTSGVKPVQKNGLVEAKPTRGPLAEQVPSAPTTPVTLPPPTKSQEQINIETRAALVNILCTSRTGINGISGSGIIVDSRGVILTNAHVGQ